MTKVKGFRTSYINTGQDTELGLSTIGDFNGDGIKDYSIAAPSAYGKGRVYILFNNKDSHLPDIPNIDQYLENNPSKGFWIASSTQTYFGNGGAGSVGDINNDGLSDFAISSWYWYPGINYSTNFTIYIIYGQKNFTMPYIESIEDYIDPSSTGFAVTNKVLAFGVSVCDINNDGIADLLFSDADYEYNNLPLSGAAYILYGRNGKIFDNINNLDQYLATDNTLGFKIYGSKSNQQLSWSFSGLGDVNGDGISDFTLGSPVQPGAFLYVIYGRLGTSFTNIDSIDSYMANPKHGFIVTSSNPNNFFGSDMTSIGDINNDGVIDLYCGVSADSTNGINAGGGYVIFGQNRDFANITSIESYINDNQDYQKGFKIYGSKAYDNLGWGGGFLDVNGDGITDMLVEANNASYTGVMSGAVYVIYGKNYNITNIDSIESYLDNSANGFKIYGENDNEHLGRGFSGLDNNILLSGFNKTLIIYPDSTNYGMFSEITDFDSMNHTNTRGSITLGNSGYWCKGDSLYIGDFNGDNKSDLLCNRNATNSILLSNSTNIETQFYSINSDPNGNLPIGLNQYWCSKPGQELLIGDFNGDNKSDLLCRNVKGDSIGNIHVMLSNGTNFYPMGSSSDGLVNVGDFGPWCLAPDKLVIGSFTGNGMPSLSGSTSISNLLCNDPLQGGFLMVPNGTSFISYNPSDPTGAVAMGDEPVWCIGQKDKLLAADFNGDGLTDLVCNSDGFNMIMLSNISIGTNFYPITSDATTDGDGSIHMGRGNLTNWCSVGSKLLTGNVNADQYADLICNDGGINMVQLCGQDGKGGYMFTAMNHKEPTGNGAISMNNYESWCTSGSVFAGNFRGLDINGYPISDIWCNQPGDVL